MMLFFRDTDIEDLPLYLPADKIAIVSPLSIEQQQFMFTALQQYHNFTHLIFSQALENCTFLPQLGNWLGGLPVLRYLAITETRGLGVYGIENLFLGLTASKSLLYLDLSAINLGPEGAYYAAEYVRRSRIIKLHVRGNNLQASGVAFLLKTRPLISLDISDNNIHPMRWPTILSKATISLQKLITQSNAHTNVSIGPFCSWIAYMNLSTLDLSHTELTSIGVRKICDVVPAMPKLAVLKLDNCGLSEHSMYLLAVMLEKNTSLERLGLLRNPFRAHSFLQIILGMQKNYTLLQVDMEPMPETFMVENGSLRLPILENESVQNHIMRILCHNQDMKLRTRAWSIDRHHCYPARTQVLVFTMLLCFQKFRAVPIDIQYHIMSFWVGRDNF